eukprot:TRINITY_DN10569_c0_g1_i19.p2 TRINITY_DN10569_c0_g1~~TRINITY_DN10569_c0_g1_i19.p2  ORF type:complete len:144 (+),score=26.22 TRINITY_DN10569_c0_g1_i19:73-504(+)
MCIRDRYYTVGGLIFLFKLTDDLFEGLKRDCSETNEPKAAKEDFSHKKSKQNEKLNETEEQKKHASDNNLLNSKEESKAAIDASQEDRKSTKAAEVEEKKTSSKPQGTTDYLNDIQCGICIDVMYQAVTLMPCLHNVSMWVEV